MLYKSAETKDDLKHLSDLNAEKKRTYISYLQKQFKSNGSLEKIYKKTLEKLQF